MNFKQLIESRNDKITNLQKLKEIAKTRAITDEENKEFETLTEEIRALDTRIKVLEAEERELVNTEVDKLDVSQELREFLKNPSISLRAYGTGVGNVFKASEAGAIIPKTLSDKIIEKILAESDILPKVTR